VTFALFEKAKAYLIASALIGLIVYPLFKPLYPDSFPFSSYPMFSAPRIDDSYTLTQALGLTAKRWVPLPPHIVGTEEVVMAGKILDHTASRGPDASAELCRNMAKRVSQDPDHRSVQRVQIATRQYRSIKYFSDDPKPEHSEVHAECSVMR